jgi:integrase
VARFKLSDPKVRAAYPGWHGDGDGLWLRVLPSGTRSWVFVYIRQGKRRELGLGSYGRGTAPVSLALAREKADEVRAILARGGDPFAELPGRKAARTAKTFGECCDEFLERKARELKHEKHVEQWRKSLTVDVASLRPLPVANVSTDDVVKVLREPWQATPELASKLRGRIEMVLNYAAALGVRSGENPARFKGHLDHILGKRQRLRRGHHKALPYREVPTFMTALRARRGFAAKALEFTILTAARTGETIGATWNEIDFDAALWNVPASRMKMGKPHSVPLSSQAVKVLRWAAEHRMSDYVFAGQKDGHPLSEMAFLSVLKMMEVPVTAHGFRSSFRDWCGDETTFPLDLAKAAIAHSAGDAAEVAYRRSTAVERRRPMMQAWADWCDGAAVSENVLPIRRHADA